MISGERVLALVPARGGSKGIPRKNVRVLAGKPLIAWAIEAGLGSRYVDDVVVSTEDAEISTVARASGARVPCLRPEKLASDTAGSVDVALHMVDWIRRNEGGEYGWLLLLQPTSPLRTSGDIDRAVEAMLSSGGRSVVSFSAAFSNPHWMVTRRENNRYRQAFPLQAEASRRQDLPGYYEYNGAIYLSRVDALERNRTFEDDDTVLFEMDRRSSIDIDDETDWVFAEALLAGKR